MNFVRKTILPLGLMLLASALAAQQVTNPPATDSSHGAPTTTSFQPSEASAGDEQVRIVRLSEASGAVQVDRNTGNGFEPALLNLPVTQGVRLQTVAGFAEIEFEDNSTLRLAPNSIVVVRQLEFLPSGATASTIQVQAGTVYASLAGTKGNQFLLAFGAEKIALQPSSHIRLHVGHTRAKLAVMDGNVQVSEDGGPLELSKKKTATFMLAANNQPTVTKNVDRGKYDTWDQQAIDFHKQKVTAASYGNPVVVSGLDDMNYYGGFVEGAACGPLWRPYFAGPAWDPFANGNWVWYSGSGYSFVSPYPWGWTAYHSGSWEYCENYGWGWRPRGDWVGLKNTPKPRRPVPGFPATPRPPSVPPRGPVSTVAVNHQPPVSSGLNSPDKLVIRRDSAGLGIPRGNLGNLSHVSRQVEQRGTVNLSVTSAPMATGAGSGRTAERGSVTAAGRADWRKGGSCQPYIRAV